MMRLLIWNWNQFAFSLKAIVWCLKQTDSFQAASFCSHDGGPEIVSDVIKVKEKHGSMVSHFSWSQLTLKIFI